MEYFSLYIKLRHLPLELKDDVNNFIDFLLSKKKRNDKNKRPKFGCAKGTLVMSDDFDEPLSDFKEYTQ